MKRIFDVFLKSKYFYLFFLIWMFFPNNFNNLKSSNLPSKNQSVSNEYSSKKSLSNTYKSEYLLGAGDTLFINFIGTPIFGGVYPINPEGFIFLPELNRFKVVSGLSREHWIEKGWIYKEDPLGWFQWYCRFTTGRRIPHMDEIQIKRWKNFRRHVLAIEKNCESGDLACRKKQRQAILQWAYNPYR